MATEASVEVGHGHGHDEILNDIRHTLNEQNRLLQSIINRQFEHNASLQPIPAVPARSSSAWNPLLDSTIKSAQPTLERWRGGLDTLLIFVGFFSSIVASFLVESSKNLKPDEGARTNELLMNLTEILIGLGGDTASNLVLSPTIPFTADPVDIRVNFYWSLSLVISILAAALAVAGRGFLALLIRPEGDAAAKLTELHQRWSQAKLILGPLLEALPQILMVPFSLFVIGLLDYLLSSSLAPEHPTLLTLVASVASCFLVALVGVLLLCAVTHGVLYPATSPFQTILSRYSSRRAFRRQYPDTSEEIGITTDLAEDWELDPDVFEERDLTPYNREAFHLAIQRTYEDDVLDQASAALEDVILNKRMLKIHAACLSDLEIRTLLHLLSPEASLRSNLTAARTISNIYAETGDTNIGLISLSTKHRTSLANSLLRASNRHESKWPHPMQPHTPSLFITAIVCLLPIRGREQNYHPLITLLSSSFLALKPLPKEAKQCYTLMTQYAIKRVSRFLRLVSVDQLEETAQDNVLLKLLGPCTLLPVHGLMLWLSMARSLSRTWSIHSQDILDRDLICECINRWLASSEHALDTILRVVDWVLLEELHPKDDLQKAYPLRTHPIMEFVLHSTKKTSYRSLLLCVKFILRIEDTFLMRVDILTLHLISRFISLLDQYLDQLQKERKDWNLTHKTLTCVYQWTLYHAWAVGEFDIDVVNGNTLPPREEFIANLKRIWAIFNDTTMHSEGQTNSAI